MNILKLITVFNMVLFANFVLANEDPRERLYQNSPKWLYAVGRIITTPKQGRRISCSGNLISDNTKKDAILVLTAKHCVRDWEDIKEISITFKTRNNLKIKRNVVKILESSEGNLSSDWAVLHLNKKILNNEITPLVISERSFEYFFSRSTWEGYLFQPIITVAGYSRDEGLGEKGKYLTYHEGCLLGRPGTEYLSEAYNCLIFAGASGGAVVLTSLKGEDNFENFLIGVIRGTALGNQPNLYDQATWIVQFSHSWNYWHKIDKLIKEIDL